MALKPAVWQGIALGLAVINLVAAGFAAGEPRHLATHIVLGAGFGGWAWWLRGRTPASGQQPGLDALQAEVSSLRRELTETQERLDFTERMLAQRPQQRQVGPER
ncbi:MAG TPA: hypothetical protein VLV16_06105 [Gemmatimonadales bacterium]|nr:hypothetical protein [Gemmatimonadales bacterium]